MIEIVIGGDVCPIGGIADAFEKGNARDIFHDLTEVISCADLSVVNLECPLISHQTPIFKDPVLGADVKCIRGFTRAGWDVLNLANNHSFDHGERGLRETIMTVQGAGLSVVGAGENIEEARQPFVREIGGKRIVIYAVAEREFSIADEKTAGANPMDLISFLYAIQEYKEHGVFVVLVHGGKEYYSYPSPEMVRRCHFMVDMGADAVICCHAHCPLPWEIYAGRPIVYGMGNLIFETERKKPATWNEGYLVKLKINSDRIDFEVIPYIQSRDESGAQRMGLAESKLFFEKMQRKTDEVKNTALLIERWRRYCYEQKDKYLIVLFAYNRLMRKIGKALVKILHPRMEILRSLLLVQCETHREILTTLFKDERRKEA